MLRGRAGLRPGRLRAPGAGSCSRAASTRRRRSSRRGSPRWRTPRSRSSARSTAAAAAFAALARPRRRRVSGQRRAVGALQRCAPARGRGGLMATLLGADGRSTARAPEPCAAGRRWRPRGPAPRAGARSTSCCRGDLRGLPAALRRAPRACAPPKPTSGCWRATSCTRSGSRGWSRSATRSPWPSSPTRSRSSALAQAAGEPASWRRRSGRPARAPSAGARATSTGGPRSSCSSGAPEALEAMRTSAEGVAAAP